ncbi:MAG: hypothetical protein HY706_07735 [Candidatus Hydrogenedentes bacterium]|nr:hypothetical protein [Candidatus Hydrogenedentota bacterium]
MRTRGLFLTLTVGVLVGGWWGSGIAVAQAQSEGDVFALATCPVSGEKLGSMGDPVVYSHEGREIRFCCKSCEPKFQAEPAKYLKDVDAAMVQEQMPYYPLATCAVSGEALGEKPTNYIYNNRLVRFCCSDCIEEFKKDPAKVLSKLDAAATEKQKADYPLDTCLVSGKKLETSVDMVSGNRLVRFCCPGCPKQFKKDPAKYLSMLDESAKGKAPSAAAAPSVKEKKKEE